MDKNRIISSAPILLVKDVIASAAYYRNAAGFSYDRFWGEPPDFCILARDGCHLMLSQVKDPNLIVPRHQAVEAMWDVYFWVSDARALYDEVKSHGAHIDYDLCDQPYGCREFAIKDLDGHRIAFGQNIQADESQRHSRR